MNDMSSGPIDLVLLRFEGNEFNGGIAPALRDLVARGVVRIVDILFVYKDGEGKVGSIELGALGPQLDEAFIDIDGQLGGGLLDPEDVDDVAKELEPNSSMAVVAVENIWAIPFIQAVRSAGGELVDQVRVPSQVVDDIRTAVS